MPEECVIMRKYSKIISLIIIVALTFASVNVFDITKVESKKSVVKSLKVKGAKKTLSLNIGNYWLKNILLIYI